MVAGYIQGTLRNFSRIFVEAKMQKIVEYVRDGKEK